MRGGPWAREGEKVTTTSTGPYASSFFCVPAVREQHNEETHSMLSACFEVFYLSHQHALGIPEF